MLQYLKTVNCVQFDPIDVTGRNHELVLQARVGDFSVPMLYEALYSDRALVDGFDKNMCIYLTEDWPYFKRTREAARAQLERRSHPVLEAAGRVRQEIEARGALSSADLEMEEAVRWPWGPTRLARAALEGMYFWGELVVHHKEGVRKVYDLAERRIPSELLGAPEPNPSEDEYHDWRVCRRIGSVGLLCNRGVEAWLGIEGTSSGARAESLKRLLRRGEIREVSVEGLALPAYVRTDDLETLSWILGEDQRDLAEPRAAVIGPLDNLIWDRRLTKELFGFDYTWEVYVPAAKRRYGYYVLPVLYKDRFVARFEPVRDRKTKTMVVKNWWWEEGVDSADPDMRAALSDCLQRFCGFLGCASMRLEEAARQSLAWL
ncbi:MAG: winged helix-turn-helix domain-containing protein [Bacillota bacterium]